MAFKINPNYYRADVLKKLYDLRAAGETFHAIGIKLNEEYGFKMTDPTVKSLYLKYVAKNLLVQNTKEIAQEQRVAGEIVPDYQKKMEERFDKIAKITDDLMDTLTEMKDNMEPEVYVKTIPTILMVAREILNQLNYIKKEQSQVLVNQKNIIYSPLQIMQIVNNELTKMEKQGLIEFKDAVRRQIKIEQPEPRKNADKILEVADILTKEEVENEVL